MTKELINYYSDRETLSIASDPDTHVEALVKLAEDEHWDVRYSVAGNPNTPVEVLTKLAEDEHWDVRRCVLNHPYFRE